MCCHLLTQTDWTDLLRLVCFQGMVQREFASVVERSGCIRVARRRRLQHFQNHHGGAAVGATRVMERVCLPLLHHNRTVKQEKVKSCRNGERVE